ncbi:hypothetical protein ADE_50930 [Achromobacter denitrificans]|nr:hypothetical protein ADE_50930 [Achromobacter denitrificans]
MTTIPFSLRNAFENPMPRLATRTNDFLTFQVMELFKQAQALQAAGKDIISLGIGEPDFTAPPRSWKRWSAPPAPGRAATARPPA